MAETVVDGEDALMITDATGDDDGVSNSANCVLGISITVDVLRLFHALQYSDSTLRTHRSVSNRAFV